MNREPAPNCTRTDAILALHLDGDVDDSFDGAESGYAFVCGDSLQSHLRDCPACQRALRRARRLDAALAQAAGRSIAGHGDDDGRHGLEQRWFAAVANAAELLPAVAAPTMPPRRGASAAWLLFAAATGLIVGTTCFVLTPAAAASTSTTAVSPHATTAPTRRAPEAPPAIATGSPATLAPSSPIAASALSTPASLQRLKRDRRSAPAEQLPALSAKLLQHQFEDRGNDPGERLRAAEVLLDAGRGNNVDAAQARATWIEMLAAGGDRTTADCMLHGCLLDRTRNAPHLLAELRARLIHLEADRADDERPMTLTNTASVIVATRVGDRDLDPCLQRLVRHQPELAVVVAGALRCDQRPHGAGALLLALWQELAARGDGGDDERIAALWFQGQPGAVFTEVLEALRNSRSAPQRQRCLLALGHAGDDRTVATLRRCMQSGHRDEAFTAAFALANLPQPVLTTLPAAAVGDEWLLRAALARSGLPAAHAWIQALLLRPDEEAQFGRATLAEFPRVASWFRDRGSQLGD